MQCNYTNPLYGNPGCNTEPFCFGKPPPYPQIIGEGDLASIILPDGTVQLYFVPAQRRTNPWQQFPFNPNVPNSNNFNANTEIWIVRSISHPFSTSCWNRTIPNVYGDQLSPLQINPNLYTNQPCPYYQKFHNDCCTSTSDIKYYYPKLRCEEKLKYSVDVQTEPINNSNTDKIGDSHVICCCESKEAKNLKKYGAKSSTSYMSVDSSKSHHKLRKRHKKTKKSKPITDCECDGRTTLDKSVTTYADRASGSIAKDGTHTQTRAAQIRNNKKSKGNDIKTEIWIPIDSNQSSSSLRVCGSGYCYSGSCSCDSRTDISLVKK